MDLGIAGRTAIVCASSQGLGRACALQLALAGCNLVINGRDATRLANTAAEIRAAAKVEVLPVLADLDTVQGRAALLAAAPTPDILVNNNGGPPLQDFRKLDHAALLAGVESNMIAPIELVRQVVDGMVARRFGRIVNITSGSVKMPRAGLDLSSGARAGLTGFLAGVARSVVHANVTINFLLPGEFDTQRLASAIDGAAKRRGVEPEVVREERRTASPAGRFGVPGEFGAACAFLCSAQAGFITGQSLLIDGGSFPGRVLKLTSRWNRGGTASMLPASASARVGAATT